jgi:hypothetical protein
MTRKINKEKYERILDRLTKGEKQSSIVIAEKCSYGTISAAKQWDKEGRPTTITTTRNTSTNRTKIVVSIPNFWLENLNEDIMAGIWIDYSDAIVDIIRTYFRTRMETYTPTEIETPRGGRGGPTSLRGQIMKELKKTISPERFREFGKDDLIPEERAKQQKNRKVEIMKEKELIYSRFKDQKSENYVFKNYHGQPLIKEEYEVLIALEQQVGEIPKWEGDPSIFSYHLAGGDYKPIPADLKSYKFSYVILGNHIIILNIQDKGLKFLPSSINHLSYLHTLDLRNNSLNELPESIGDLEFLEELILHDNALKSVPESIGNLKNLRLLHLDNNELTTLPETICNLNTVYPIGLSNNKIASQKICELDLAGNPIMEAKE